MTSHKRKSRFFIAILPPAEIQNQVDRIKQHFSDRYDSRAALKSPPHITLQPPFEWEIDSIYEVTGCLEQFSQKRSPFPLQLSGFGTFAARVIYINVAKVPELLSLQADLRAILETSLGIKDPSFQKRPYAPHMTVAFRDLSPQNFKTAWLEFESQPLAFDFIANRITLLVHNGQRWNIHREFELNGTENRSSDREQSGENPNSIAI